MPDITRTTELHIDDKAELLKLQLTVADLESELRLTQKALIKAEIENDMLRKLVMQSDRKALS